MAISLYWIVQADATATPTGAQIVAGQDGTGAAALASGSEAYTAAGDYSEAAAITGLSAGTAYEQAWVAYDGVSYSSVVTATITTLTSVQQDLAPSYVVRSEVQQDLTPTYAVRSEVTSDLSPSYAVTTAVQQDLAPSYAVRSEVTADLTPTYTVDSSITSVSNDLTCTYGVSGSVQSDLTPAYEVRASIESDLTPTYVVRVEVQQDLAPGYVVRSEVFADLDPIYVVRASVQSDLTATYAVQTTSSAGAADVWSYVMTNGFTAEENVVAIRSLLSELHLVHGLLAGSPLSVTATRRLAGSVDQSVDESGGTVTVTRQ